MSDAVFDLDARLGQPWKKPAFVQRPWLRWALILGFIAYFDRGLHDDRSQLGLGSTKAWNAAKSLFWPLPARISPLVRRIFLTGCWKASS